MFSKYVLFKKGHLNKRAGVWTPWTLPLDPPLYRKKWSHWLRGRHHPLLLTRHCSGACGCGPPLCIDAPCNPRWTDKRGALDRSEWKAGPLREPRRSNNGFCEYERKSTKLEIYQPISSNVDQAAAWKTYNFISPSYMVAQHKWINLANRN